MIIDTDTHNFCVELFEDFEDQDFYRTLKNLLVPGFDPDKEWKTFYNEVKRQEQDADAWPDTITREDFHNLPLPIKQTLKSQQWKIIRISDDLQSVHIDNGWDYSPSINQHLINGTLFCNTTHQVINLETTTFLFSYPQNSELATRIMRHYNKKMCDLCEQNPHLDFNLYLAMHDIDACLDELHRYKDRKFFGVLMDDRLPWALIPAAVPVFEFCNQHKIPVYLHVLVSKLPVDGIAWDFDHKTYKKLIQQYPFGHMSPPRYNEWKTNVGLMITENIFDRWPDLRIVLTEKHDDWFSPFREFMIEQGWPDPLPYFQKHFWITTEPEQPEFFKKAQWFGWDRLLFATDYPHNDPGGSHRYKDVDLVSKYLHDGLMTQAQHDQLMCENYLFLKNRI